MHLQPKTRERVVYEQLDNPGRRVELIYDRKLVRRPRRTFILLTNTLLLLTIEELIYPSKKVGSTVGLNWQIFVDRSDHSAQRRIRGPYACILVGWVEKDTNLACYEAER